MYSYDTVTEALADLQKRGFVLNFNLVPDGIVCSDLDHQFKPDHFHIKEVYRFEGMSDPGDSTIIYAIESDTSMRGILINAYGMYADMLTSDMVHKLRDPA